MFRRKRKDQSQGELRTDEPYVGKHVETLAERVERLKHEDQARFDYDGLPPYVLLPTADGVRIVGIG